MNTFLISWNNEGIECILDISGVEEQTMLDRLAGTEPTATDSLGATLAGLRLRATVNSSINHEVYVLLAHEEVTLELLEMLRDSDPQALVDMTREKGVVFISHRDSSRRVID